MVISLENCHCAFLRQQGSISFVGCSSNCTLSAIRPCRGIDFTVRYQSWIRHSPRCVYRSHLVVATCLCLLEPEAKTSPNYLSSLSLLIMDPPILFATRSGSWTLVLSLIYASVHIASYILGVNATSRSIYPPFTPYGPNTPKSILIASNMDAAFDHV